MLRVRAALTGWQGAPGLMTWYLSTTADDATTALACVANVRARLQAAVAQVWPTEVYAQVAGEVDVINAASGDITDTLVVAAPAVVQGAGAGTQAPPATAIQIRLRTASFVAGRRVQGRQFISPLDSSAIQADGTPTAGAVTAILQYVGDLAANWPSGTTQVVWHRPVEGSGGLACDVIGVIVPDKFAVLKSRRD